MDDEKLIAYVRACPCLYDKTHTDFKNPEKKRRAWMGVAKNLEMKETVVMKRWGNLRERFSKEIRIPRNTSGSGASVGRQWALLDSLDFLRGHIIPRPMRQSAPLSESSVESGELSDVFCATPSSTPLSPDQSISISPAPSNPIPFTQSAPSTFRAMKRKGAELDELDTAIMDTIKTCNEVCARKAPREEFSAEIIGFGTMICSAITKMKKSNQALVMRRCTEIVMQTRINEEEALKLLFDLN